MNQPEISLVISTYNRATLLREALDSVAASTIRPVEKVEIIVVDNNSTDNTPDTIERIRAAGFAFELRYVKELSQGISHARNRGIKEARGNYVAFMDDDQRIDSAYLANIESAFKTTGAVCVGGPLRYYNATNIPPWLVPIAENLGQLDHGEKTKILDYDDKHLPGGNMVFETSKLAAIGEFDTRLGHHGTELGGQEDWEIQDRVRDLGMTVAYHPDLIQYHYLRPERFQKRYWKKLQFAYGRSLFLRGDWTTAKRLLGVPRHLWWALFTTDLPDFLRSFSKFNYPDTFVKQLQIWQRLGKMYEARRHR